MYSMYILACYIFLSYHYAYAEKFHRMLTFTMGSEFLDENADLCWHLGKYMNPDNRKCEDFPRVPNNYEIQKFANYTKSEIEYICKQMWLRYDPDLKFCVVDDYDRNVYGIGTQFPIDIPVVKYIKDESSEAQKANDYANHIICLKGGMDYDYETKQCDFLKLTVLETARIDEINEILKGNVRRTIWDTVCANYDNWYDPGLKSCVAKQELHSWKTVRAEPKITYHGSEHDDYEKHLYCALLGLDYDDLDDACPELPFNDVDMMSKISEDFHHIYVHAKDVMCAHIGMLYQRQLDICVQTELIKVRRRQRHIELCLDPRCGQNVSEAIYGPNHRLIVSAKDKDCFKLGKTFQKGFDQCDEFPGSSEGKPILPYRVRYLPHVHQLLRAHCYKLNMDYNRRLRICVHKVEAYLSTSEFTLENSKVQNPQQYSLIQLRKCMVTGLDYDTIKDTCLLYPTNRDDAYKIFYKGMMKEQVKLACGAFGRKYIKRVDFCPDQNDKTDQSSTTADNYANKRRELISKYCYTRGLIFDNFLQLCVKGQMDKSELRKYSYKDLLVSYCMKHGLPYDPYLDACSKVINLNENDVQKIRQEQGMAMCRNFDMQWDSEFGFCVMKRKPYELATPPVPFLPERQELELYQSICFATGMYYEPRLKHCDHIPFKMDRNTKNWFKKTYQPHIDHIYGKFCNETGMTYDKIIEACVVQRKQTSPFSRTAGKKDQQFCFLQGMEVQWAEEIRGTSHRRFSVCGSIKDDIKYKKFMAYELKLYREMYVSHRCPVYMEYNKDLRFCTRRKLKSFDLHFEKETGDILMIPISRVVSRSKDRNQLMEDIRCCFYRGLNYDEQTRKCVQYRVRPTKFELQAYKTAHQSVRDAAFTLYCESQNLHRHPVHQICVKLDQF